MIERRQFIRNRPKRAGRGVLRFDLPAAGFFAALAAFDLSAEAAEAIVGVYEIAPGNNLTVKNTAIGLTLAGRNGPELPLEPIGPDRFFYRQLFVEIEVSRDPSGDVDALLWGGSFRLRRLE